jgi:hypothetical protein
LIHYTSTLIVPLKTIVQSAPYRKWIVFSIIVCRRQFDIFLQCTPRTLKLWKGF